LRGFLLGLGLIVAIGAQNAFVLERGLVRNHVFVVCLVCAVSDALLIAAGVAGLGTLISSRPTLILVVTIGGAIFLGTYALVALRRALRPAGMDVRGGRIMPLWPAVLTVLGLTFLNPHVYLDTVILLGSVANQQGDSERWWFAGGAMLGSVLWFGALGFGARLLRPLFARPVSWRVLDGLIAVVMLSLGIRMAFGF
jgi:L-lysine exporter family protein LysE/ArgO